PGRGPENPGDPGDLRGGGRPAPHRGLRQREQPDGRPGHRADARRGALPAAVARRTLHDGADARGDGPHRGGVAVLRGGEFGGQNAMRLAWGATGSVLRTRATLAGAILAVSVSSHGFGVPNPWHPRLPPLPV